MKDMIYRQDLYDRLQAVKEVQRQITAADVAFALRSIPSVDAVEVVRCRECIYHYGYSVSCENKQDDFFCSMGKRRPEYDK